MTDFWNETNWFVIQAKPYQEGLAAARVAKFDVEVFFPRIKQEQLICRVLRVVTKPLFAGYFFARFCPLLLFDAVRYAQGVLRVVGTKQFPIPLETEIISGIRERVGADGFIRLDMNPYIAGNIVTVEQGPFAGWMGEVEREADDGRRVLVLLEALQMARLLIEKRWLSLVVEPA